MKNNFLFSLLAFVLHAGTGYAQTQLSLKSAGGNDAKAEEILEAMSERYQAVPAYKTSFTYTLESSATGAKESYPGELTVKGGKYRLKMGGQEIINNGTTVWTYMKESNEVNISDYEPEEDEIAPNKIFTVYKKGYKSVFTEENKEKGVVYEVVDLIPENRNNQVFKIRLTVSKKDKSIKSMQVFEKNGNRSLYTITKFVPDVAVDDKLFAFDKSQYKDVEIIDLR
ncbi:MAG: outer membrane lipoprotein carrier protein LolA [Ferruginibacter sp.]|nr:outer membrane lipoprotein carrier protein LolA [Cytophagales bacterium]